MKILITGAAGFIGSNLVEWLLENTDHQILGIDNLSGGYTDNYASNEWPVERIDYRHCDITDRWQPINDIFEYFKPDVCYHFAAYAAEGLSPFIRKFNYTNNTVATAIMTNLCIKYNCKLIFTSSVAVYSGTPPFTEKTIPNPVDPYGVSKYASEMDIRIAGEQHGLDWVIIRPRNIYGERQNLWDKYRNVFGIWINQHLNKEPMTIYGDGSQIRSFTYIGDILEPLYKSAEISREIINLGSARTYSIREANQILCDVIKDDTGENDFKRSFLEQRHEVKEAFCHTAKSIELLNFRDQTDLFTGLANMWLWACRQPKREIKEMELELDKGLYNFWKK